MVSAHSRARRSRVECASLTRQVRVADESRRGFIRKTISGAIIADVHRTVALPLMILRRKLECRQPAGCRHCQALTGQGRSNSGPICYLLLTSKFSGSVFLGALAGGRGTVVQHSPRRRPYSGVMGRTRSASILRGKKSLIGRLRVESHFVRRTVPTLS